MAKEQDLLLKPEELNNAVFMDDGEGGLMVKPDAYLEVAKAQLAKVLKRVKPDREKIARYQMALYCKAKGWEVDDWDDLPVEVRRKYYAEADEILALIPDEEEIRKQERERIIKYLDEANDTRDLDKRLQALKGE